MKATAKVMLPDCPASAEEGPMIDEIKVGTILIRKGTVVPDSFRLERECYSDGWKLTKDLDGYDWIEESGEWDGPPVEKNPYSEL